MVPLNGLPPTNRITLKVKDIVFWFTLIIFSLALWTSLVMVTAMPLIIITLPMILYDRAYFFPIFMAIPLAQGAFISGEIDTDSFAESIAIASVLPLLLYDIISKKSNVVPYRFVVYYVIFGFFIVLGVFVYYQHTDVNYKGLNGAPVWKAVVRSIVKLFKISFFFIYLKVLINYPKATLLRTLDFSRRIAPFIVTVLGIYLVLYGQMKSGASTAGADTLQMGDAHHGAFTSQLCSLGIFLYITLFMKEKIWNKMIAAIAILLMFIMIMQMGSRNGLVTFALVSALGLYVNLKGKRLDFQFLVLFFVGIIGVIGVIYSLDSPTVQRAIYMTEVEGGGNRWYYWEAGLEALSRNPFLGLGGDESSSIGAVSKYAPGMLDDKVMHNSYLEMAVEYGIFGLIFYMAFLFMVMKWGYRLFKFGMRGEGNLILTAPAVSYLILMVSAIFVSRIWETAIWYNVSFVLASAIVWVYPEFIRRKRINTFSPMQHQMQQSNTPMPHHV